MNNNPHTGVLIVGAGQAGSELSGALRKQGYSGSITLIGDEQYPPYRRPPLSKQFLAGEVTLESLFLKSGETYAREKIVCGYGIGVESIDRNVCTARLFDGTSISYGRLVLATGGRARRLSLPGAERPNVHYVRQIDDIVRLREQFLPGKRLIIIGGGYIGLEAASVGIKNGLAVTIIEALPRVLARVAAPALSAFYERAHRSHGVDIRTGIGVHSFEGSSSVETVVLADGTRLPVDLLVVGIGLIPNTELAEAAGLEVSNGIVVDSFTRTADPNIYSIGDCCNHENMFLGRRLRLESVPNAIEQARVCAASICGKPTPYSAVPWFWSDQYDLKLQMVGISQGYDEIAIRGDINGTSFCAFYLANKTVISAEAVNRPQEFMVAKKLIAARARASVQELEDERLQMRDFLPAGGIESHR
jgi:3-phenylpropionate/trans-cinnamate dioxygenase ferredoxin reductase component